MIPINQVGKASENLPLCTGHTGPVLDTDWSPFKDTVIASGSEDTRVMVWNIPEAGLTETMSTPSLVLDGHTRKVGSVLFHPTAENVLASSSTDGTIRFWDINSGQTRAQAEGFPDVINSISYNYNGSQLAATCKDKKLRLIEVRTGSVTAEVDSHVGIKGSRTVWLGNSPFVATTGFSRTSERQVFIWDSRKLAKPLVTETIDQSAGMLMPFYDDSTKMLYLAGKGDGNIRYYEWDAEETRLFYLTEYKSASPQRGMGYLPKRGVNVSEVEVARLFKCADNIIEPISFRVPRKGDSFQADIFPPCPAATPAVSAADFFEKGKAPNPILLNLENNFSAGSGFAFNSVPNSGAATPATKNSRSRAPSNINAASAAPAHHGVHGTTTTSTSPLPSSPLAKSAKLPERIGEDVVDALRQENEALKRKLTERDSRIKVLEEKLEKLLSNA